MSADIQKILNILEMRFDYQSSRNTLYNWRKAANIREERNSLNDEDLKSLLKYLKENASGADRVHAAIERLILASEEPVVEEVKAEETVVEEVKAEEPVVEEVKAEETVVEEVKAEDSAADENKAEDSAADENKAEDSAADENKAEEAPADGGKKKRKSKRA